MRRNSGKRVDPWRIPPTASRDEKLASFRKALEARERLSNLDTHMNLQLSFLPPTAPYTAFIGPSAMNQIQEFLCLAHSCVYPTKACPVVPFNSNRSREDPGYVQPQYVIKVSDLRDDEINRIAGVYAEDYCGLPLLEQRGRSGFGFECRGRKPLFLKTLDAAAEIRPT
jgi:hypothetical protein